VSRPVKAFALLVLGAIGLAVLLPLGPSVPRSGKNPVASRSSAPADASGSVPDPVAAAGRVHSVGDGPDAGPAADVAPPAPIAVATPAASAPGPTASPISDPGIEAALENVQFALRDYRAVLGGNPVGNNAEITAALLGDNPRQLRLPLPEGSALTPDGELADRWGTPYFFHQLSGSRMEIRSAGPDRRMWTADDGVQ